MKTYMFTLSEMWNQKNWCFVECVVTFRYPETVQGVNVRPVVDSYGSEKVYPIVSPK